MNYVQPGYVRTGYVRIDSDTVDSFTFDGHGKKIIVSSALERLNVAQMYSRWQDWARSEFGDDSNFKWPVAMRYSGNDPIPGGFTGATFFMTNGWRVSYDPNSTAVDGVLFSENFGTAFWSLAMQPIFPVSVSAVVNQVTSPSAPASIAAAILAAAQATPIWANAKQINDTALAGTGISGDEWGPA